MSTLTGKKVLLVEDEFIVAENTAEMLRELGAEVVGPAARLASGLRIARTEQFDSAVLDINIAGERSDPIAEVLRERGIPYVLATGYGNMAAQGPDVPVLDKPYTKLGLQEALTRIMGGGGLTRRK